MNAFWLYKKTMLLGTPLINAALEKRVRNGKEDPARLNERKGSPIKQRPSGPLVWIHVASVGEAQSVLRLVNLMLDQNAQLNILVTSVTRTSAQLLGDKLPPRAFHQYAPVDHPVWIRKFLDYWHPDMALWIESELWPNMLTMLNKRHIPSALINAHMSANSYRNWKRVPNLLRKLLSSFLVILAQSAQDGTYYTEFAPHSTVVTDNIKYAAKPLAYDDDDYSNLKAAIGSRPIWLYASSHAGEEILAADTHKILMQKFPDLLTIIAPRHPERRGEIEQSLKGSDLKLSLRGTSKSLPKTDDQIYIADTMGELGLFYALSPVSIVGRSFSDDGGGGHNPIEPALLKSATLHGPNVQNMPELYTEMDANGAAVEVKTKTDLAPVIENLLSHPQNLASLQEKGYSFAVNKAGVLGVVLQELEPVFLQAHLPAPKVIA